MAQFDLKQSILRSSFYNLSVVAICIGSTSLVMLSSVLPGLSWFSQLVFLDVFLSLLITIDVSCRFRSMNLLNKGFGLAASLPLWSVYSLVTIPGGNGINELMFNHALVFIYLIPAIREFMHRYRVGNYFRLTLTIIIATFAIHIISCLFMIIYPGNSGDVFTHYNKALYWTVTTLTTVGYGDITPSDNASRVFTMFVMMAGVGFYGLVVGQVSRYMLSVDRRKEKTKDELDKLDSFLKYYNVPLGLRTQTFTFYQHLLTRYSNEDDEKILDTLPKPLKEEIQVYINLKPISNLSLFNGCSLDCLTAVAKSLDQKYFAPGERIICCGDEGVAMYMIGHGQVRVHRGEQEIANLGSGQVFGEMSLITNDLCTADVTASSYCDIFVLSKEKFKLLTDQHTDLHANVQAVVASRAS